MRASAAGDLGRCLTGLESALQAFEQAGDLRNACAVRTNLGYMYSELGDFQRAEAALRQALLACDRMGLLDLSAAVQHNLGRVLGFGAELAEAERLERLAIEAFRRQGDPRLEGLARIYLAEILIAAGRLRRCGRGGGGGRRARWRSRLASRSRRWGRWRGRGWAAATFRAGWPRRARRTRRSSGWARSKRASRSCA